MGVPRRRLISRPSWLRPTEADSAPIRRRRQTAFTGRPRLETAQPSNNGPRPRADPRNALPVPRLIPAIASADTIAQRTLRRGQTKGSNVAKVALSQRRVVLSLLTGTSRSCTKLAVIV